MAEIKKEKNDGGASADPYAAQEFAQMPLYELVGGSEDYKKDNNNLKDLSDIDY